MMQFVNIKEKRLFEKIVDQIKDAVRSGNLKAGDPLPPENQLAHDLGVSRTALREALRILELSGLVLIKKGNKGGTFVQDVSSNKQIVDYFSDHLQLGSIGIQELTETRYWVESMVIDIVAQKATTKDFEVLAESIERARQFYASGQEREKLYENFNFHILLARITRNRIVVDMLSAINELLSYMMAQIKPSPTRTEKSFRVHRKLVALLAAGEWSKAKTLNGTHIKELSMRDPEFRRRLDREEVLVAPVLPAEPGHSAPNMKGKAGRMRSRVSKG